MSKETTRMIENPAPSIETSEVSEFEKQFKHESLLSLIFKQFLEHRLAVASVFVIAILMLLATVFR